MIAQSPATAKVGEFLPEIIFGPVSRSTLALYAGASGDHNPIHIDTDFAKQAGLDDVFAHGMLSMAQVGRVVTDWVSVDKVRSINARFRALTHVGEQINCAGEITEKFSVGGEEFLRIKLTAQTSPEVKTVIGEAVVCLS